MIDYDFVEAGKIISEIQLRIFEYPDINDIWLDYEEREVVIIAATDGLEYCMSIDEFLHSQATNH